MTITKEYRITLPITLDEYRVAQLYSVAESSKVRAPHIPYPYILALIVIKTLWTFRTKPEEEKE